MGYLSIEATEEKHISNYFASDNLLFVHVKTVFIVKGQFETKLVLHQLLVTMCQSTWINTESSQVTPKFCNYLTLLHVQYLDK